MLKDNLLIKSFRETVSLLDRRQRKFFYVSLVIVFIAAVIDLAGMSLLLPPVIAIIDPDILYRQPAVKEWVQGLYARGYSHEFSLILFSSILTLSFVIKNAVLVWVEFITSRFRQQVADSFSVRLLEYYTYLPLKQLLGISPASISFNAISVSTAFAQNFMRGLYVLISELFIILLAVAVLAYFNTYFIVLLCLTVLPITSVAYFFIRKHTRMQAEKIKELSPPVYQASHQFYNGNVDIRLNGSFGHFARRFEEKRHKMSHFQHLLNVFSSSTGRLAEVMIALSILIVVVAGTYLVTNKQSLAVTVMLYATIALRVLPSLNRIMSSLLSLKSYGYTVDVLKLTHEINRAGQEPLPFNDRIRLENIKVTFKQEPVLSGLSLEIKKGSCIGLYGRSGSGKSTLLNVISGFVTPSEGSVYIDDQLLGNENNGSWWSKLSYVKQDSFLIEGTIKENIAFGIEEKDIEPHRLEKVLVETGLVSWVKNLPAGIDTQVGELGNTLSGGQKQLITMARALYRDSGVFLLDEVTSSLDIAHESQVINIINRLKAAGKTIIIVAHRITTLQGCDVIYEIKDKTITRQFSYKELFNTYQVIQSELVN